MKNNLMQKRGVIALALFSLVVTTILQGATTVKTQAGDDVEGMELRAIQIDRFENEPWEATSTPFDPIIIPEKPEIKPINDCKPKNLLTDASNKNCMGLRFRFVYPGTNVVELVPPKSREYERFEGRLDENQKPVVRKVRGIRMPGKVKAISIWVLGRGNEFNLEGWVEDWKGNTHIYQFGSLDFVGWRPLTITIPENVPQDVESFPQTKNLVFKKLVLRSTPKTSQEEVVVFFDSLKVLTDTYDVFFDGADVDFDDKDKQKKADAKNYQESLNKGNGGNK